MSSKIVFKLFILFIIQQHTPPQNGIENNKMQEPKKLTIRMNFSSKHNNTAKNEIAYQYHWGRIIGGFL